ncbi:MAG: ABC transporter ATP-binding protein [Chloroflexi bacterium]|nr:ABC transporter ATP-binding protein [Chloroflexota bacterium]
MTTVTLEHITKRYEQYQDGERQVITAADDLSLKATSGQIITILGPSGCGKSTVLRIIAGLIAPDSGRVLYDNVPLAEIPAMERGVGMVFQEGALMPHWEAERTIGFFLRLRQREHEVPERMARIAQITGIGLEQLLSRKPRQLSGGERQRVGIARALARDPRVFLFDEPFSNIDAKLRAQARVELKRLLHAFPVTSFYVTHDQVEAIALADRIVVMRAGRIEQVGAYRDLYDNPINLFVATFIGTPTINCFAGRAVDGQWHGENFGGFPIRGDLPDGTPVTAGIRPEFVQMHREGMPAVVDTVTPYYAERFVLLEVHGGGEHWQISAPPDFQVEVGETVYCTLDPDGLLFFDTQTGQRIG